MITLEENEASSSMGILAVIFILLFKAHLIFYSLFGSIFILTVFWLNTV